MCNLLVLITSSIYTGIHVIQVGRNRSVGLQIRYCLDGPGMESRWGRDFQQPFRPDLAPTHPSVQWVEGLS
jgi:hypothetical protein